MELGHYACDAGLSTKFLGVGRKEMADGGVGHSFDAASEQGARSAARVEDRARRRKRLYITVRATTVVCVTEPLVAVTVMLLVPAGVTTGVGVGVVVVVVAGAW
jgi:hypothetical protein